MKSRRAFLIALFGASAVPTTWTKPIVKSAVLPAHAEQTIDPCPSSDIRLKTNIRKLEGSGTEFQFYRFEYRADPNRRTFVGVMAQHLEASHPESVIEDHDGLLRVNYGSLGLKMTTLEDWNERGLVAVKAH